MTGRRDTRERIVQAARAQILEAGMRAATVRAIAGRAGVTTGAIYHHFGGKAGLVAEVCTRAMQALGTRLETAGRLTTGRPLEERLTAVIDAYASHFIESRGELELTETLLAGLQELELGEDARKRIAALARGWVEALGAILGAGPDRALVIMALATGIVSLERQGLLEMSGLTLAGLRGLVVDRAARLSG